ncbi:methionine-R-sulfoxide reductase B1-A [Trichonephila inaurata madagascariensis]|uniref:peptide-methionine (R)-S-oxide reductase n=1 Tax=Trichonephila inaurata madagascariensis TaxID=2747483 RepID=A0A8X6WVU5_9ARAC|nr:methionine-R-sulfoxide reductase B1-A [Trichonephila inaurata madagascariensis]
MSFCAWITDEKYRDTFKSGTYNCSKCGNELFSSRTKFKHFSPWPSFTETVHENSVIKRQEKFRPSETYKVSCGKCGYGLGHEFVGDGPVEDKANANSEGLQSCASEKTGENLENEMHHDSKSGQIGKSNSSCMLS